MKQSAQSVTALQVYMLLITSVGFMNHVLIEPVLFNKIGRDAWISVVMATVLLIAMVPFLLYLLKNTGELSLFDWFKQRAGKSIATIMYTPVVVYLFCMSAITLKDTHDWLKISYLPQTPGIIISIVILFVCVYVTISGLRTLAIMTGVLLPVVLLLGYFVATANFPYKNYDSLMPFMEHGVKPVLHGAFYAWGGFIEIVLILWLKHHVPKPLKGGPLFLFAFLLLGLTLGPITGALAEFGPSEAIKQRYPAYEEWRLVQIGKDIEHVDFLSLYQWMSGIIVRTSLGLFLIMDITGLREKRKKLTLLIILALCLLFFTQVPFSDTQFLNMLSSVYFPASIFFSVLFILSSSVLLFILKGRRQ